MSSVVSYLGDAEHSHHQDYELSPLEVLGVETIDEFLKLSAAGFEANRKKRKAGRPPKNSGNWFIMRVPDGTNLKEDEIRTYEKAIREAAGYGAKTTGLMTWHHNPYSGSADLNLLTAAFTADGDLVRNRNSHPIKSLRWRMDQVTDELNVIRKARRQPPTLLLGPQLDQTRKLTSQSELEGLHWLRCL